MVFASYFCFAEKESLVVQKRLEPIVFPEKGRY